MCLHLRQFVAFASFVLHSFLCHSLVLYSPARCIYQGLLGSIPGRARGLPGRGGIFGRYLKVLYQLYPHRLHVHSVLYSRAIGSSTKRSVCLLTVLGGFVNLNKIYGSELQGCYMFHRSIASLAGC